MIKSPKLPSRLITSLVTLSLVIAACGGSDDTATSSTAAAQSTTSEATTTAAPPTTTTVGLPDPSCPDGLTPTTATVVGVQDYVRVRSGPSTASDELGQLEAGSSTEAFGDSLTYDGSQYWWVAVQIPGSATCGNVAAEFLSDPAGRMDQQIPGLSFLAPTASGTWTFTDRTSLSDPIQGSLDGAFLTQYAVTVLDGLLIDQLLADQLADFQAGDYEYPEDWNTEVTVPGADRAVRLVPIVSGSGDVTDNRLIIEVGDFTLEVSTSVYIEDLEEAPLDAFDLFLDSVELDRETLLEALSS